MVQKVQVVDEAAAAAEAVDGSMRRRPDFQGGRLWAYTCLNT